MTADELSKLTPEQKRILIHEARGYRREDSPLFRGVEIWIDPSGEMCGRTDDPRNSPDYLNDLNAMHEAEKTLSRDQMKRFSDQLSIVMLMRAGDDEWVISAAAEYRADAFLRTVD